MTKYETVIGLEVHTELSTKSKIFCSCTTAFGEEPNTNVCPICTGMPGTLPVLNKQVVENAIAVGLATNCNITPYCKFDRKNYFYPDLPKAYQVSQLYLPICTDGHLEIEVDGMKKTIGIREIHMEEDAGKLIHDENTGATMADYNRCGVPLLEIVSNPDFENADEVVAYLTNLKAILQYLGVSDCKMQEGSLRADVNLSVRPEGQEELGTRTEMKNLNSFKAITRAIENERERQIWLLENGDKITQETRRWDDNKGESYAMRSKEDAQDYRYFPEPDLAPMVIDFEWIERVRASQPELPQNKMDRYIKEYNLPSYDANQIVAYKNIAQYFEDTVALGADPKEVSNWIMGEVMRALKDIDIEDAELTLSPQNLALLIKMIADKTINRNTAKDVFVAIWSDNIDPQKYVDENNLAMVNDDSLVLDVVAKVMENNPKPVEEYRSGKQKAFGFLVGQCMKELKGKADPGTINTILKEKLNS